MEGKDEKGGCGCGCSGKKNNKKWLYLGLAIVVVSAIAGWYFFMRKKVPVNV
jgi:LPXTG-motif cell wall-anchored protein